MFVFKINNLILCFWWCNVPVAIHSYYIKEPVVGYEGDGYVNITLVRTCDPACNITGQVGMYYDPIYLMQKISKEMKTWMFMDKWMDGWMGEWMDRSTDGRTDGRMEIDGWMDR